MSKSVVVSLSDIRPRDVALNGQVEWAAQGSFLVFGVRIGLRTERAELLELLASCLPPLWTPSYASSVDRTYSLCVEKSNYMLFANSKLLIQAKGLKRVFESFTTAVKMFVAEMAPRRVFVHAGAVGWKGSAILIPGRSMSGKSTLVAELIRAGATYYSDEYAVLDARGLVHPYPQPLAMRRPGSIIQRDRRAEELGGVVGTVPLPVGLVVVSRYKSGSLWRPRPVSLGNGLLELMAHTVPARRKPAVVVPTLQKVVSRAKVLKGVRGEAKDTARRILERVDFHLRDSAGGS